MTRPASRQGINIAFIGTSYKSQVACAEYCRRILMFKRMDLNENLVQFVRTAYGHTWHTKKPADEIIPFYDAIYKTDHNFFIDHFRRRFEKTEKDVVVADVRYLNELQALRDLGFVIVRVTVPDMVRGPNIGAKIKTAEKNTVILSMLYDKNFAINYNVEYSINYTSISSLSALIDPILEQKGYVIDKTT